MNIYEKLMKARIAVQSSKMKKSGENKYAGYAYFELGDFVPIAMQEFFNHGLCGVVSFSADLASLTITNIEKPDEQLIITSPMANAALKGAHEIQNLGAVQTYQRRYLWMAALEIVEHDAIDGSKGAGDVEEETKKRGDNGLPWLNKNMPEWAIAKKYFTRDGNLKFVLSRYRMTKENQEKLIAECEPEDVPQ